METRRRKGFLFLVSGVLIFLSTILYVNRPIAQVKLVRLGVVASTTGLGASYGVPIRRGIELAFDEIAREPRFKNLKIELLYYDDKSDKSECITIMRRLIHTDKVTAILGPHASTLAFAVLPMSQDDRIPNVVPAAQSDGIAEIGEYIFQPSGNISALAGAEYLRKVKDHLGVRKIGLMVTKDWETCKLAEKAIKKSAAEVGIEIILTTYHLVNDLDFRAQLLQQKEAKPEAVIFATHTPDGIKILRQRMELGLTMPFITITATTTAKLAQDAGPSGEGVYGAALWHTDSALPKSKDFVNKFIEKYKEKPDAFAASGYDAAFYMAEALLKAPVPTDRTLVKDALKSIKKISGVTGDVEFNEYGLGIHKPLLLVIKKGAFGPVKK